MVELIWLDPHNIDGRDAAGAMAVLEAARAVDCPYQPSGTLAAFAARLIYGWDGDPPRVAVTRDEGGRVIGVLEVHLSQWDNTHTGFIEITVDPLLRRQGLGRRLYEAGVETVRADGRTLVLTESYDLPGSVEFAKTMGLDRASVAIQRRQDLTALDWARLDEAYASAQGHAAGYDLVRLAGTIPEEMVADVAQMTAAINDAPIDDLDVEDEVFSPERIRAFEVGQEAQKRRVYRLVARERETGILAGHTVVGVESETPWLGYQFDTSVLSAHRGHRLGLLLKIGMLRWLREEEPQLRTVDTWNAASNAHMIAVNEMLGYQVVAEAFIWQRHI